MPLFNNSPAVDAANSFGQAGPRIAQGQARGMELGEQRRRDQANFIIQQMTQQRMLAELKQRMQQQAIENQFREQQMSNTQQQFGETQRFHQQMSEDRRKHDVQQLNEFAIKMHQGNMKDKKDEWQITPQGFLLNKRTGDTKWPQFGQAGATNGPAQGGLPMGMNKFSPVAAMNSVNPVVDYGNQNPKLIDNNPTNTMYNPGFASQYSQGTNIQAHAAQMMLNQMGGGPQLGQMPGGAQNPQAPPGPVTNMPPRFRFDPSSKQLVPQ